MVIEQYVIPFYTNYMVMSWIRIIPCMRLGSQGCFSKVVASNSCRFVDHNVDQPTTLAATCHSMSLHVTPTFIATVARGFFLRSRRLRFQFLSTKTSDKAPVRYQPLSSGQKRMHVVPTNLSKKTKTSPRSRIWNPVTMRGGS